MVTSATTIFQIDTETIPVLQHKRWVKHIAGSVKFVRLKRIVYCDLQPTNLISNKYNLQLYDFGGSLLGKLDRKAIESTCFFLLRDSLY
jgi:serine/threonine protein kinase